MCLSYICCYNICWSVTSIVCYDMLVYTFISLFMQLYTLRAYCVIWHLWWYPHIISVTAICLCLLHCCICISITWYWYNDVICMNKYLWVTIFHVRLSYAFMVITTHNGYNCYVATHICLYAYYIVRYTSNSLVCEWWCIVCVHICMGWYKM